MDGSNIVKGKIIGELNNELKEEVNWRSDMGDIRKEMNDMLEVQKEVFVKELDKKLMMKKNQWK